MSDVLRCELLDRIAVVTLSRPDRRNALSGELLTTLRATLAELDADPGVRLGLVHDRDLAEEHPDGVPEADPVQRAAVGVENEDEGHRGSPPVFPQVAMREPRLASALSPGHPHGT